MRVCALLLLLVSVSLEAEVALGRLFLTPENRSLLDRQRWRNPYYTPATFELPPPIRISGVLRKSTQGGRLWINGEAQKFDLETTPSLPAGTLISPATGARQGPLNMEAGGWHR